MDSQCYTTDVCCNFSMSRDRFVVCVKKNLSQIFSLLPSSLPASFFFFLSCRLDGGSFDVAVSVL